MAMDLWGREGIRLLAASAQRLQFSPAIDLFFGLQTEAAAGVAAGLGATALPGISKSARDGEGLRPQKPIQYNARGLSGDGHDRRSRQPVSGLSVSMFILAGMGLGAGIGYGIDVLTGTMPLFLILGMVAGLAIALYSIYMETR